jgi:hypothetical protein
VEGVRLKDKTVVNGTALLGHEGVIEGSSNSTSHHRIVIGGEDSRLIQSDIVGQANCHVSNKGKNSKQYGGVYNDGPRNVFLKLNKSSANKIVQPLLVPNIKPTPRVHPIPAAIRKQQKLIKDLHLRTPFTSSNLASSNHLQPGNFAPNSSKSGDDGVHRKRVILEKKQQQPSLSSAGEILCCSSINPIDIRNCNKRFVAKFHQDAIEKVWKEATDLGVVGADGDKVYVKRILINENKEDEDRIQREHHQQGMP